MLQSALYFIITFNHCQPLTLNSFCFNTFRVITFNVCWSFVVLTLDLDQFSSIFPLAVFSYVFFALCIFSSWGCGMNIAQNVWAGLRTTFRTQLSPDLVWCGCQPDCQDRQWSPAESPHLPSIPCVCARVCTCAYVCAHMHAYKCASVRTCICVSVCVCLHVCWEWLGTGNGLAT